VVMGISVGVGVITDNAPPVCIAVNVMPDIVSGLDDRMGVSVGNGVAGVWGGGPQTEPSWRRTSPESGLFGQTTGGSSSRTTYYNMHPSNPRIRLS